MSTATNTTQPAKRVRKLLSLDGGGVRGLSSIIILGELLKKINGRRNLSEKKEPWQEFDLIGGTSTGGLLATMLGRLRMGTDECEKKYAELSEAISTPVKNRFNFFSRGIDFLNANGRFNALPLENEVQAAIEKTGEDKDASFKDSRADACRV